MREHHEEMSNRAEETISQVKKQYVGYMQYESKQFVTSARSIFLIRPEIAVKRAVPNAYQCKILHSRARG